MKLGIIAAAPSAWTGGLNYILNMSRILRQRTDIEPVIFIPGKLNENLVSRISTATGNSPQSLTLLSATAKGLEFLGLTNREVARAIKIAGCDAVFEATGFHSFGGDIPVISWLPDFQHKRLPEMFTPAARHIRELRFRKVTRKRKNIVVSSEDARSDLEYYYPKSRAKVSVLSFAIDLEIRPTQFQISSVKKKYNLPKDFVFIPNQFWTHKNHRVVIEALALPHSDRVPVIVTSGNPRNSKEPKLFEDLVKMVDSLGLAKRFIFLGNLPYEDVIYLNAGCRAMANPSLFEGWHTGVEESKSLGTPLILSDINVHREQAGEDAIYFDPRDPASCLDALNEGMSLERKDVAEIHEQRLARYAGLMRSAIENVL